MQLRREHRDRTDTEVAVLDALADQHEEGMTVFELRSVVGTDIDELETALSGLQSSGLVSVEREETRTVFLIDESAIEPEGEPDTERGVLEWLSDRFGL